MYILPLYCQWVHSPGENKQQIHINCVFKSISKLISCYGYLITNTSFHISQCIQVSLELIVQILLGLTGLDAEELGLSFFGILDRYFSFSCTCKKIIQYTTKPLSASITAVENYCQHYKINMAAIYKIIEKYRCVFNLSCILQHELTYPINRRIF